MAEEDKNKTYQTSKRKLAVKKYLCIEIYNNNGIGLH